MDHPSDLEEMPATDVAPTGGEELTGSRATSVASTRSVRSSTAGRFFVFKIGRALLIVLAVTMVTQWLLGLAPGGVAAAILGENATAENVAELEATLGLDRPFFVQYFDWLGGVVTGDLGTSPVNGQAVTDRMSDALPITIELVALSMIFALALSIGTGMLAARSPNGVVDRFVGWLTSGALAVPTFVLGPVLLYALAVQNPIFPVTGWEPLSEDWGANLRTAFLPALCVALPEFAVFQRILRADLVGTLEEDYIDAARARGISERRILIRHAFRPASISLVTITGLSMGRLVGGTVVVESLFVLPGLGRLLQGSILTRDLVTLQGIVVLVAIVYVVLNLLVDLSYGLIDPRIRTRGGR